MKDQIISLFEYGEWVNELLLGTTAALTDQQFSQNVYSSYESAHLTLPISSAGEALLFARYQEQAFGGMPAPNEGATVAAIGKYWAGLTRERIANLVDLNEAEFSAKVHWTNWGGKSVALPRWSVNHSTHHCSELAAILTELGHAPDDTDLMTCYLERAGQLQIRTVHHESGQVQQQMV